MRRREFLKKAAVTAATVAASSQLKAKTPTNPIARRTLGRGEAVHWRSLSRSLSEGEAIDMHFACTLFLDLMLPPGAADARLQG